MSDETSLGLGNAFIQRGPERALPTLLAEVSAAIGHIEKGGTAPPSMGSFRFVQETAVMAKLKPLLDERGIILRPDVEQVRLDLYARSGKDGPGCLATVTMALYAIRGLDEVLLARTVGQGADTQDKAVGKATTSAKKQAVLIAFSVPTGEDPEAENLDERQARPRARRPAGSPTRFEGGPKAKMIQQISGMLTELSAQGRKDANRHSVKAHVKREYGFDSITDLFQRGTDGQIAELGVYVSGKLNETEAEAPQAAEAMSEAEAIAAGTALLGGGTDD